MGTSIFSNGKRQKKSMILSNFILLFTVVLFFIVIVFFSFKACTAPSMPLMLHNHRSVCWEDSQSIMVLGGGGNCFSFGTHLNDAPVFINLPPS